MVVLQTVCLLLVIAQLGWGKTCGPGWKENETDGEKCIQITNEDVMRSLNWLSDPPAAPESQTCQKLTKVQGMSVCEDHLPKNVEDCNIWSVIGSVQCNHYGSLEWEKFWSKRCKVTLFHYTAKFKGNVCEYPAKDSGGETSMKGVASVPDYPNLRIVRRDMWENHNFHSFYKHIGIGSNGGGVDEDTTKPIHVFKIQTREGVYEDLDGVQFTILSDLFLHKKSFSQRLQQVVFTASINMNTLADNVGREAENAWNMYGTTRFLKDFAAISTHRDTGTLQPQQFKYLLDQARVDSGISYYHHTFVKVHNQADRDEIAQKTSQWQPAPPTHTIRGQVPPYCRPPPDAAADEEMQKWITRELNIRCHPTRLWVPCEYGRTYDAFVPCPEELSNNLAEDYANQKHWCDFTGEGNGSEIPVLVKVDAGAGKAFSQPYLETPMQTGGDEAFGYGPRTVGRGKRVRLAFFFTVYSDEKHVRRLLDVLFDPEHYYLLHVDPSGSSKAFKRAMRELATSYNQRADVRKEGNVFLSSDVPIVYGASTATILLSKTMAWFAKHTTGWDYFVPVTGSDYPLVPLRRMEAILAHQNPPMPFVMGWTPGTSTHIFRLEKTVPMFEEDPDLALSIKAVTDERGKVLGAVPMEYRSTNFGPPLFCNGKKSFYHLDNRRNKSGDPLDTQWLFPRDKYHGRAYSKYDPKDASLPPDGGWRIWKKSDPATTGAYDRESVDYIVDSEEGRKYYHYFKHMLLGSEEHYYVSLLYNWPRTQSFVQTLSAQTVWNTWELGLWEQQVGFQTHTHFLTTAEWQRLVGMSKRGMFFARKFNSKKTPELLDKLDEYIHHNETTDAGLMWPGYYDVDVWTPGKTWVAAYRRNETIRNKEKKAFRLQQKKNRKREKA